VYNVTQHCLLEVKHNQLFSASLGFDNGGTTVSDVQINDVFDFNFVNEFSQIGISDENETFFSFNVSLVENSVVVRDSNFAQK